MHTQGYKLLFSHDDDLRRTFLSLFTVLTISYHRQALCVQPLPSNVSFTTSNVSYTQALPQDAASVSIEQPLSCLSIVDLKCT